MGAEQGFAKRGSEDILSSTSPSRTWINGAELDSMLQRLASATLKLPANTCILHQPSVCIVLLSQHASMWVLHLRGLLPWGYPFPFSITGEIDVDSICEGRFDAAVDMVSVLARHLGRDQSQQCRASALDRLETKQCILPSSCSRRHTIPKERLEVRMWASVVQWQYTAPSFSIARMLARSFWQGTFWPCPVGRR